MDIMHDKPINKLAAIVTSKGVHYNSSRKPNPRVHESSTPIPVRDQTTNELKQPQWIDLTGTVKGLLTVIGVSASTKGWVSRCSCGVYCVRSSRALKNKNNSQDRCENCRGLAFVKRNYIYQSTGKSVDIKTF